MSNPIPIPRILYHPLTAEGSFRPAARFFRVRLSPFFKSFHEIFCHALRVQPKHLGKVYYKASGIHRRWQSFEVLSLNVSQVVAWDAGLMGYRLDGDAEAFPNLPERWAVIS